MLLSAFGMTIVFLCLISNCDFSVLRMNETAYAYGVNCISVFFQAQPNPISRFRGDSSNPMKSQII